MKKLILGAIAAAFAGSVGIASAATVVSTDTPVVQKKVTVHTTPSGNTIVKKKVALKHHPMHRKVVMIHHARPHHVAVVHHPVTHRKVVHKVIHSDGSSTKVVRRESNI